MRGIVSLARDKPPRTLFVHEPLRVRGLSATLGKLPQARDALLGPGSEDATARIQRMAAELEAPPRQKRTRS